MPAGHRLVWVSNDFFLGGIHIHIAKPNIIWRFSLNPIIHLRKGQTWNSQLFVRSTNPLLIREKLKMFCCLILKSHATTMRTKHSILSIMTQSHNSKYQSQKLVSNSWKLQNSWWHSLTMDFKPCTGIYIANQKDTRFFMNGVWNIS